MEEYRSTLIVDGVGVGDDDLDELMTQMLAAAPDMGPCVSVGGARLEVTVSGPARDAVAAAALAADAVHQAAAAMGRTATIVGVTVELVDIAAEDAELREWLGDLPD